ncbi:hypothetical protein [Anaerosacchariphilus polymeriproducens]|uniref:Uncharacterized protein n=1 Tax=Anaerosacchariphilus polymeriproducens TaxID=1812858 RepID=A0A371AUN2_9FIRM|nr:hypothetical protein [Anaerosacchariphilus polymeriproducens]RDU23249.1 hypothetical protein DWV06_10765 [Anaerosacchariphilus polymeriproducens]
MKDRVKINLPKFKYLRSNLSKAVSDVMDTDKGITFGTYTNLSIRSQLETIYNNQFTQMDKSISLLKTDIKVMRQIQGMFEKVDRLGALHIRLKVKKNG